MTTDKVTRVTRLIIIAALTFLPSLCFGRAEIYARPVAQYTWLPVSGRNVDVHPVWSYGVYSTPMAIISNYTLSNGGLGVGLAVGAVLGKNRQFEVGAEATLTRYNCTYTITPLPYYKNAFSENPTLVEPGPVSVGRCTAVVRTVLTNFRRYLGNTEDQVRPYLGCFFGTLDANFSGKNLPSGSLYYYDRVNKGYNLATGLSGGAIIKLGQETYAEAGYRFLCSSEIGSHKGLYRNAHMINLALSQRF
jgi:hypothetical protein